MIVEEAPRPVEGAAGEEGPAAPPPLGEAVPLILSAKTEPALRESAVRLAAHLRERPQLDLADVAHSLLSARARFELRAGVAGEGRDDLLAGLDALATGAEHPGLARGLARTERRPVFVFPGHGSQWPLMGSELIGSSPVFAAQMRACEEALEPYVDWSLDQVLRDPEAPWLQQLDVVQPALFALMVSLARLWQACGVEPAAVVGQSQGEIAAAHIAGGLSLEDATRIVARRSRALLTLVGKGGTASVAMASADLVPLIEPYGERVALAAINGPASLTLSGESEALEELLVTCEQMGVRVKRTPIPAAAHSAQVEGMRDELLESFAPIVPRDGHIPFHSTVSGELVETGGLDAEYWYRNLRQTVQLEPVLRSLLDQGARTLIEVGPHPLLGFAMQETVDATPERKGTTVLGSLRRDDGGARRFALSLAQAHCAGARVDWDKLFAGARPVQLPTYPFQRKLYWPAASAAAGDVGAAGLLEADHPLLGGAIENPEGGGLTFIGRISRQAQPWLADHGSAGIAFLPAAALVELALAAGLEAGCGALRELTLSAPLVLPEAGAVRLQVSLSAPAADGERAVSIHSRPQAGSGEWACHARGALGPAYAAAVGAAADRQPGDDVFAEVSLAPEQVQAAKRFVVHPTLLDAAAQAAASLLDGDPGGADAGRPLQAFSWSGVCAGPARADSLRVRLTREGDSVRLAAFDADGALAIAADAVAFRPLDPEQLWDAAAATSFYELEWRPVKPPLEPLAEASVANLGGAGDGASAMPGDPIAAAHANVRDGLVLLREKLAAGLLQSGRQALLTERAVVTGREAVDLARAPLWGLVRCAQFEHPGRLALIDTDGSEASQAALEGALALSATEPQLAIREGRLLAPRIAIAAAGGPARGIGGGGRSIDPDRTVLISGGTGSLGSLLARHLVERHAVRRLLLLSRRGADAEGAAELAAQLTELGAEVRIEACDVADRDRLEAVLGSIDPEHPLGAVVHAAGALAAGTIESTDEEQLRAVFAPKLDAAWHLHELTKEARPLRLRPLLLDGRHPWQPRPGGLRRRQRFPRCARPATARRGAAGDLDWLGALGAGKRRWRPAAPLAAPCWRPRAFRPPGIAVLRRRSRRCRARPDGDPARPQWLRGARRQRLPAAGPESARAAGQGRAPPGPGRAAGGSPRGDARCRAGGRRARAGARPRGGGAGLRKGGGR